MAATKKGEWSMERLIKLTLTDRGHFRVAVKGTFSLCYNRALFHCTLLTDYHILCAA